MALDATSAVRAGREAGNICKAACLEVGRETCYCSFPAGHIGNVHGCMGDFTHPAHVWAFDGREAPKETPIDTEVQCPNCNLTFQTKDSRNIDISKITLEGNVVKKPAIGVVNG